MLNDCAMIKIIFLLELFAILAPISHSENNAPPETSVTLSSSEERHLARFPKDEKFFFGRLLQVHAKLKIKHSSLATAYSSLATNFHNFLCLMPHVDLMCAMSRMKFVLADFFNTNVKEMSLKETRITGMDSHTLGIIAKNDKRPGKIRRKDWQPYTGSDRNSTDRWYRYISERDSGNIPPSKYATQKFFIDTLESYYEKLDSNTKSERGYTELNTFKRRFASVITRCHRIACHYHHSIEKAMSLLTNRRDDQGNIFSLSTALLHVVPAWYFDAEHIDFLNIVQEVCGNRNRYYAVMTITNSENEQVVIPGLPNCFRETVTPDFYAKLYSIMP